MAGDTIIEIFPKTCLLVSVSTFLEFANDSIGFYKVPHNGLTQDLNSAHKNF